MPTQDWGSALNWGSGGNLLPAETYGGVLNQFGQTGYANKLTLNDQNAKLISSLGYGGSPMGEGGWSNDAMRWLQDQGYSIGVGHRPGTEQSFGSGRDEYWGLLGPGGNYVAGQAEPTRTAGESLWDNVMPMLLAAGPVVAGIAAAGGAAGMAGGAAGSSAAGGAGAAGGLSAAGAEVSALGPAWSPSALGLTGAGTAGTSAATLAELGTLGGAASGVGAGLGAGAGAISTLPAVTVTGSSVGGAAGGLGGLGGLGTVGGAGSALSGLGGDSTVAQSDAKFYQPGGPAPLGNMGGQAAVLPSVNTELGYFDQAKNFLSGMGGSGWGDVVKGAIGLINSNNLSGKGEPSAAANTANAQLAALLQDPANLTKLPGYEAGLQAVQRTGAAQGYLGSGNMMIGLDKYAGDFYNNTLKTLSGIANEGRGINQQYDFASTELLGNAINSFGYGLTKLFGD